MDLFKSLLADQNLKAPLAYRIGSQIARSHHEKMGIHIALGQQGLTQRDATMHMKARRNQRYIKELLKHNTSMTTENNTYLSQNRSVKYHLPQIKL